MHVQRCMPEHLEAAGSTSKLVCQIWSASRQTSAGIEIITSCTLFQGRFEACGVMRKAWGRNTPHFSCHTSHDRRRKSGMSWGKHRQSPRLAPNFQTHLSCDRTTWVTRWDCFFVVVVVAQIKSGPWTKPFDYHRYKTEEVKIHSFLVHYSADFWLDQQNPHAVQNRMQSILPSWSLILCSKHFFLSLKFSYCSWRKKIIGGWRLITSWHASRVLFKLLQTNRHQRIRDRPVDGYGFIQQHGTKLTGSRCCFFCCLVKVWVY